MPPQLSYWWAGEGLGDLVIVWRGTALGWGTLRNADTGAVLQGETEYPDGRADFSAAQLAAWGVAGDLTFAVRTDDGSDTITISPA